MTPRLLESRQLRIAAVATISVTLAGVLWTARTGNAQPATPLRLIVADGGVSASIELSEAQWSTFDIRPATNTSMRTLAVADAVVMPDDRATVPVFSPATGRVTEVDAEAGQTVRRGSTLAMIAGTETAQAQSDLAAAVAQARTAERQLALSREVAARQQALVDAGGGAAKDWHQSQSDLIASEGAKRVADAALIAARIKATSVGADASGTDGAAGPARLVAPADGQVIQRQVAPGQFVSSLAAGGATPLFTVSDLRRLWVVGSVGERDGGPLHVGQAVEISTLAAPGHVIKSTISWIAPMVDPQTRRVQFRAEISNADLALKPQMTARIRVIDTGRSATIAIPTSAIIHDGDDTHCYVVTGLHALALRQLKIGRTEDGLTEVLSGLKPGEQVVTRGAIFVDTLAEGAAS